MTNPRRFRTSEKIYRLLLTLTFPSRFRQDLGKEMVEMFRDRCSHEYRKTGLVGLAKLWLRTIVDLAVNGTAEKMRQTKSKLAAMRGGRRRIARLDPILQDLHFAFRALAGSRFFVAVAVSTLALGIGANTAIFNVVNSVLLQPLPYPDSERLVAVWRQDRPRGVQAWFSYPDYVDVRARNKVFSQVAVFGTGAVTLTGDGEPQTVRVAMTSRLLSVLGVAPVLGRGFSDEEQAAGGERVVLLSHALWQQRFGADPGIVGSSLTIDGQSTSVVGVAPPGFDFPDAAQLWIPLTSEGGRNRGMFWLRIVARLASGTTLRAASADVERIVEDLEREYPGRYKDNGALLVPLQQQLVGSVRPTLLILFGAAGLVLLIACTNVANLILARNTTRLRDLAVRSALGAGRGRLVRQLMLESLLLAILGAALGSLLAIGGTRFLTSMAPPGTPGLDRVGADLGMLGFALIVSCSTSLIFGLLPALSSAAADPTDGLRMGGRQATAGFATARVRGTLLVVEVALAVVLLTATGLLVRSMIRLQAVDPGFESSGVLTAQLRLPQRRYQDDSSLEHFVQRLEEGARAIPGVLSAGSVEYIPFGNGMYGTRLAVEGRPLRPRPERVIVNYNVAMSGYFEALRIPLIRGRVFGPDDTAVSEPVALVSANLARRLWPDGDPVGARVTSGEPEEGRWLRVVGVVGDVHNRGLTRTSRGEIYRSYRQLPTRSLTLVVRSGAVTGVTASLRDLVRSLDPDLPVELSRLEEMVSQSVASRRFILVLLGLFSFLAVVLAAVGIYGVSSYGVAQRMRELALRMALGADRGRVLRMVLRQGTLFALGGLLLGLAAASIMARVLADMLFEVETFDPATFAAVSLFCLVICLSSCLLPALRAARIDPMVALRSE